MKLADELKSRGVCDDVRWLVGGNISRKDIPALKAIGVDAVFPTGTPFTDVVEYLREKDSHE